MSILFIIFFFEYMNIFYTKGRESSVNPQMGSLIWYRIHHPRDSNLIPLTYEEKYHHTVVLSDYNFL